VQLERRERREAGLEAEEVENIARSLAHAITSLPEEMLERVQGGNSRPVVTRPRLPRPGIIVVA
jgi:hypothetical protein